MALEDLTGSNKFIGNLVAGNPVSSDDRREGDDHIRGIKNVLRNSFPDVAGPVNFAGSAGPFLPLIGGTLTGSLTVKSASSGVLMLDATTGSSSVNQVSSTRAGVTRWNMVLGAGGTETGGNAGFNFSLDRFSDTGTYLGSPISIARADGVVTVANTLYANSAFYVGGSAASFGMFTSGNIRYIRWATNPADLFYDYSNGDFTWSVSGVWRWAIKFSNSSMALNYADAAKTVAGPWIAISDARIKENIQDYTVGLEQIRQLRPRWFTFKAGTGRDTNRRHISLIADEAEGPMPEMVSRQAVVKGTPGDAGDIEAPDMRVLNITPMLYALVNAVKELATRIEALEAGRG